MNPEIVTDGTGHSVLALADRAVFLREYLLRHGIPCGPPEWRGGHYRSFRLGNTANLGMVQALLDRWGAAGQAPII
jgi:hypothetical protein